jgi:hypothetical protein
MNKQELITKRFERNIAGVLSCFDRLVLFGTYKPVCYPKAMSWQLHEERIRLIDYEKRFANAPRLQMTARIKDIASEEGIKIEHVYTSVRKEAFVPLPEGIQPFAATEIFETNNLSDKINGKAELYLSAGFNRLVSQRFRDERATDLWMEVFVYNMGNNQKAFSVFSSQRREDMEPLGLAKYACRTSNALFLVQGCYGDW